MTTPRFHQGRSRIGRWIACWTGMLLLTMNGQAADSDVGLDLGNNANNVIVAGTVNALADGAAETDATGIDAANGDDIVASLADVTSTAEGGRLEGLQFWWR